MKYIIIFIIVGVVAFFGWLFLRKNKELVVVKEVVSDFFMAVNEDNSNVYEALEVPEFKEIFSNLVTKYPENFKNIISVEDGDGSFKVSTDTGTTFEYDTVINYSYNNGQKLGVKVKLLKVEEKWLVYGIQFSEVKDK